MDVASPSPLRTTVRNTVKILDKHRSRNTPSKLPAYRLSDLKQPAFVTGQVLAPQAAAEEALAPEDFPGSKDYSVAKHNTNDNCDATNDLTATTGIIDINPLSHRPGLPSIKPAKRDSTAATAKTSPALRGHKRAPASHSSQGIETDKGPPPALSTRNIHSLEVKEKQASSTVEWLDTQAQASVRAQLHGHNTTSRTSRTSRLQKVLSARSHNTTTPKSQRRAYKSLDETSLSTASPKLPPTRSFRASVSRLGTGLEMSRFANNYGVEFDGPDNRTSTLRALEGYSGANYRETSRDEESSGSSNQNGTGDLFLDMAQDDMRKEAKDDDNQEKSSPRYRSRITLPNSTSQTSPSRTLRAGEVAHEHLQFHDVDPVVSSRFERSSSRQSLQPSRSSFRPASRDRTAPASAHPLSSLDTSRFIPSRIQPLTPRFSYEHRESLPSASPFPHGRRTSLSERTTPERASSLSYRTHSYRHSTLSQSMSRNNNYNSSPLVGRQMDHMVIGGDTPRIEEGTSSTASTTAPSTVWDELDNLKSRIHRLELTGKMPPTSSAAVNSATENRPPTATTTNTTMSTSPKRARNLSASPIESPDSESNPKEGTDLLHSALNKTKPILPKEVYGALQSTASDAISIATMLGSTAITGPLSSAQSVVGSTVGMSDRQLRRKAESMCRSLTELCLALSEMTPITPPNPASHDVNPALRQQQPTEDSLASMKSSPRALSRLQARRNSLMTNVTTPTLPSPRYTPSQSAESATPTQSSMPGRRTSLLARPKRIIGTEQDNDPTLIQRAPSRAMTDIGHVRRSVSLRPSLPRRDHSEEPPLPPLPRQQLLNQSTYKNKHVAQSIERDGEGDRAQTNLSSLPRRRFTPSINTNMANNSNSSPLTSPALSHLNISALDNTSRQRIYPQRNTPDRDSVSLVGRLEEARGQRHSSVEHQSKPLSRFADLGRRRTLLNGEGSVVSVASGGGYTP